jgi:hypothetical protein
LGLFGFSVRRNAKGLQLFRKYSLPGLPHAFLSLFARKSLFHSVDLLDDDESGYHCLASGGV